MLVAFACGCQFHLRDTHRVIKRILTQMVGSFISTRNGNRSEFEGKKDVAACVVVYSPAVETVWNTA